MLKLRESKMKFVGRCISMFLAVIMMFSAVSVYAVGDSATSEQENAASEQTATVENTAATNDTNAESEPQEEVLGFKRPNQYIDYYAKYSEYDKKLPDIKIDAVSASNLGSLSYAEVSPEYGGVTNVVKWTDAGYLEYTFTVPETGMYKLKTEYMAIPGKGSDILFDVKIDGISPFDQAERLALKHYWCDEGEMVTDENGNELLSDTIEKFIWKETPFIDLQGKSEKPFMFYLTAGTHTLRIELTNEKVAVKSFTFYNEGDLMTYAEYLEAHKGMPNEVPADYVLPIEAEDTFYRNDSVLHPIYDRSDPKTSPYHATRIRYNTIGGDSWDTVGQEITWKVDVEYTGWYNINLRCRQNFSRGVKVTRRLYVNGEVPFKEVDKITYKYNLNWQSSNLTNNATSEENKEEYLIYLEKGENILSLQVSLGDWSEIYSEIEDLVYRLNYIYRNILLITGSSPDSLRDYNLHKEIPGLMSWFESVSEDLLKTKEKINKISGTSGGGEAESLLILKTQIDDFIETPREITKSGRLDKFKNNIQTVGALMETYSSQPLEVDRIFLTGADNDIPRVKASFFERVGHEVKAFFATFFDDYNIFGMENKPGYINVWVGLGREQTQIFKNLCDNYFTPKTGIKVNITMTVTSLENALMSGKDPDVMLQFGKADVVRMALRDALIPLDGLEGFDEVVKRFNDTAMISLEYNDHYYAIPETYSVPLMIYRTDIFDELEIEVPKTWDEFYSIIPIIQNNNMEIALPDMFSTLLYQNGGKYYKDDQMSTAFDSAVAVDAFSQATKFYTMYKFPQAYDFFNRFRTGEMPLGVVDYTQIPFIYNGAPELRGLWDVAVIPGTLKEDGTIDQTIVAGTATTAVIIKHKDESRNTEELINNSWNLIKWWTSAEIQAQYGKEVELTLGSLARYNTANMEAFDRLPWSDSEAKVIKEEWKHITEIEEIPGSYYVSRMIGYANRQVIDKSVSPREALFKYNNDINKEITRKRKQYNLPVLEDEGGTN